MARETDSVSLAVVFFRHDADVFLTRYRGPIDAIEHVWTATSIPIEPASRDALRAKLATAPEIPPGAMLVRTGEPCASSVTTSNTELNVTLYPALFDCPSRDVDAAGRTADGEWVSPTAILSRETIPGLWDAYDRVRPTPRTIRTDTEHGSGYLSIRAMEIVRDTAGAAHARGIAPNAAWVEITAAAEDVLAARPSMAALFNRVNRIMSRSAAERTAATVESVAIEAIDAALNADRRAAAEASSIVDDAVILTLSRSGTILPALTDGPAHVIVAESRPKREGVGVAERVSDAGTSVTLCVDAAIAHVLAEAPIDAVLLGADTVLGDGSLVNKVGSRGAAIAASAGDIPVYVVTSADKIHPGDTPTLEYGPDTELYDGERPIDVRNPTFDVTPPEYITGIVTENGILDPTSVASVAREHAALTEWRRDTESV